MTYDVFCIIKYINLCLPELLLFVVLDFELLLLIELKKLEAPVLRSIQNILTFFLKLQKQIDMHNFS